MKTPWIRIILLSTLLWQGACSTPNAQFCESDGDCGPTELCNLGSQICEAVAQADAGSNGEIDETEAVCDENDRCVPPAPTGWLGPVAKVTAPAGAELPSCDGDFASDLGVLGSELQESGSCSCACGTASDLGCSNATLREWTSSESSCEIGVCDVVGGTCLENQQDIFPNECEEINASLEDEAFWQARFGQLTGGSCGTPSASGELSSEFGSQTRLCMAEAANEGCEEGDVCAPEVPEGFEEGQCIVRPGDRECPADSPYTERTLLFSSIADSRTCGTDTCSCSAPTGSCGGEIELNDASEFAAATTVFAVLQASTSPFGSDNLCTASLSQARTACYSVDLDSRSCRLSGQSEILGEAREIGATTACCLP